MLSLATGILIGAAFALLGLPIPAPGSLSGVLGVVGLFVGFWIVQSWSVHN